MTNSVNNQVNLNNESNGARYERLCGKLGVLELVSGKYPELVREVRNSDAQILEAKRRYEKTVAERLMTNPRLVELREQIANTIREHYLRTHDDSFAASVVRNTREHTALDTPARCVSYYRLLVNTGSKVLRAQRREACKSEREMLSLYESMIRRGKKSAILTAFEISFEEADIRAFFEKYPEKAKEVGYQTTTNDVLAPENEGADKA